MANEIRVRSNNQSGTISDSPLTAGATTITSAAFVDLPTIDATNHLILVLDPLETAGPAEIVTVTSHTASATTVIAIRGEEGTAAREHATGTTWFHGPLESDYNYTQREALSTNRPAAPFAGELIYETDTNYLMGYSGAAWEFGVKLGAWQSYTPSNTNVTVGNGTETALFIRSGRIVHVRYKLIWGSTTSFGGTVEIGLPVQSKGVIFSILGSGLVLDAGTTNYLAAPFLNSADASKVRVLFNSNPNVLNATAPMTWTTGDVLSLNMTYEAAS